MSQDITEIRSLDYCSANTSAHTRCIFHNPDPANCRLDHKEIKGESDCNKCSGRN